MGMKDFHGEGYGLAAAENSVVYSVAQRAEWIVLGPWVIWVVVDDLRTVARA